MIIDRYWSIMSEIEFRYGIPGRCDKQLFFHFAKYQVLCQNNMPTMITQCTRCHVPNLVWIEPRTGEISEVTERWGLTDVWCPDSSVSMIAIRWWLWLVTGDWRFFLQASSPVRNPEIGMYCTISINSAVPCPTHFFLTPEIIFSQFFQFSEIFWKCGKVTCWLN